MTLKATLVLTFSVPLSKATPHRPQGAIPYLLVTNLTNYRLTAKKSFNCAYALDKLSDVNTRSSVVLSKYVAWELVIKG